MCRPLRNAVDLYSLAQSARSTSFHQIPMDLSIRVEGSEKHTCVSYNPFPSVSHVSMIAPDIGFPLVSFTEPSTNMYSPLPSEAIEAPFCTDEGTLGEWAPGCGVNQAMTFVGVFGVEWAEDCTFCCPWGLCIVDRIDERRYSEGIGKKNEF